MVENNTQAIMYIRGQTVREVGNIADLSEREGVIILRETGVAGSCVTLVTTYTLAIQRLDTVLLSNVRIVLQQDFPTFFSLACALAAYFHKLFPA